MLKRFLLLSLLNVFIVPTSFAADVYLECSNLVNGYAFFRDRYDAERFANLFSEDAELTVAGNTWVGRENIRQRIEGLDSNSPIRHLMSTIHITPIDEFHAQGVSYATIYTGATGSTSVEGFAVIGEYHDEFILTEAGWKIQKRELRTVFSYQDDD